MYRAISISTLLAFVFVLAAGCGGSAQPKLATPPPANAQQTKRGVGKAMPKTQGGIGY